MGTSRFDQEYKKLNKAQKEAVDTIDGPVMVVAGPGTGKTQILALRIANILQKTDIKGDGILCLAFTNAAVEAMKERLKRYIGEAGEQVNIFTFHSFGMRMIEKYFEVLGLKDKPKLMEDTDIAIFFDRILNNQRWKYLRPRADTARYFQDLKSLISLLKRERISKDDFESAIKKEIKYLEGSEENISTRGESKGQLKREVLKDIEGLERSLEIVKFFEIYEKEKKENNVFDYDDVLENLVKLVETSQSVVEDIRERYLYVLVDEHQDSSRVQNEFLTKVWAEVERPDIFVVGDDRQLIYGFSGASIEYFRGFQKTFRDAKLITLVDNYRSTQIILDISHALLESVMSEEKLLSKGIESKEHHPVRIIEAGTPEEEIISAGLDIREKKIDPNKCVILVPKNRQVREALQILHDLGLPVDSGEALNLFEQEETQVFLRVLRIINNGDAPSLALSFFDQVSGVAPIEAHKFFTGENMREFSLEMLTDGTPPLFGGSSVEKWIERLSKWKKIADSGGELESLIKKIGQELFAGEADHRLATGEEIVNTILGLLGKELEKNSHLTLTQFISYLEKLELYGEPVSLLTVPKEGIKVLTMHSSKGLEFDYVWIAHMDERSLVSGKKMAFTLPESIKEKIEERDIEAIKRKLYVAITRAKRFCTISYAINSNGEREQELARVISELPEEVFQKEKAKVQNKKEIKRGGEKELAELKKLVSQKYSDRYVSVSLLNNFFECPWKWYFRNLLQLPEPVSGSLEFGSRVHAAIDKVLKLGRALYPEEYTELILEDEEIEIVSAWAKNRLPQIKQNSKNEQSVSVKDEKFPHLNMYGKIDLIENLSAGEVRVTDFKTGSVRKKSEIEKLDEEGRMSGNLRQLAMYSYLLQESPKWNVDVKESRLEFLEAKLPIESFYDRIITPKEIELLIKDIKDYDNLVKKGEWVERSCNYNSYGKNTECEYCKMAKIYQ